jgi:glycerol-3-phosphate acyltransferase PlsY
VLWGPEIVLLVGSYLLGSVPFAWLLGMSRGVDIRRLGSGNIGATNLGRVLGRPWALLAFVLDFAKGFLPVLVARSPTMVVPNASDWHRSLLPVLAGLLAVGGHVFPIYLRFRGGKGVATSFGVMAALGWLAAAVAGAVWLLICFSTRIVSLASLAAAAVFPLVVFIETRGTPPAESLPLQTFSLVVAGLIVVRHRSNIVRLWRREEHSFRASKPSPEESPQVPAASEHAGSDVHPCGVREKERNKEKEGA